MLIRKIWIVFLSVFVKIMTFPWVGNKHITDTVVNYFTNFVLKAH